MIYLFIVNLSAQRWGTSMLVLSLIISITVILFLVSRKVNIGYSLITGSFLLALLNGRSLARFLQMFLYTITETTTISLTTTIVLIAILAYLLDKYIILDRMIAALEKMLGSTKNTLLVAPAIMGTLTVYGGALMSCPMVGNLGDRLSISSDRKAAINLVFRHALYFVFPLSPNIILASQIGGFKVFDFIKLQFPIAIALYLFGYIFLLRGYKDNKTEKINKGQYLKAIGEFILFSSPILVSLFGAVIFNLSFNISLLIGIMISIMINQYDKKHDEKYDLNENPLKTIYKGIKFPMIITIVGIMLYKNTVNDIDEVLLFLNSLLENGLPVELLILIATAIICLPLASMNPGIAILFPMILPLAPTYQMKLLYAMFIYTSAFIFYFISPLHLCQVLTLDYFKVKMKSLYIQYVFVLPLTFAVMVAIYTVMSI